METKEFTLPNNKKIVVWKMNHGFMSDLQGKTTTITYENKKKSVNVDFRALRLYNIVYGLWSSQDYNIPAPKDAIMGLMDDEINQRLMVIRQLDGDTASAMFDAVAELNNDQDDKKSTDQIKKE